EGIVTLGPFAHISDDVRNSAVNVRQQLIDNMLKIFTGPILDKAGTERLKKDETAGDTMLKTMDWFVQGNIKVLDTQQVTAPQ
ncbi:MAG: hypothetical protein V4691_04285, partial [Pseudomonadota bacterium]